MFKFIDRKQKDSLVIISGWAFDHRIFETLDLPFNYFHYSGSCTDSFEKALTELLKTRDLQKVSILGWSRGAFVAADYACKNPQNTDLLILAGARRKYDKQSIETIKKYVEKNRVAFLNKFYRDCFCKEERELYFWFKQTLQKKYLSETSAEQLLYGLDQLTAMQFDLAALRLIKNIKIVHGLDDSIAPVAEAADLAKLLPQSQLIIFEKSGHLPFLHSDFKARLS